MRVRVRAGTLYVHTPALRDILLTRTALAISRSGATTGHRVQGVNVKLFAAAITQSQTQSAYKCLGGNYVRKLQLLHGQV